MTTPELKPQANKDFSDFEKEALETSSNDALKLDLQRHLNKLHREQREDIEERISAIEKRCNEEVRKTLEKHVKLQIETHFKETLKTLQGEVVALFSPLVKHSQQDVERLNVAVNNTNNLCHDIQKKYKFRWSRPWAILILSTALTSAFMGVMLYLMQVGPLAIFLMNENTRRIYEKGKVVIRLDAIQKSLEQQHKEMEKLKKTRKPSQR